MRRSSQSFWFMRHKFSISIFVLCLFEFIFWSYGASLSVADEHQEPLHNYLQHQKENFAEGIEEHTMHPLDDEHHHHHDDKNLQEKNEQPVVQTKAPSDDEAGDKKSFFSAPFLFGAISSVIVLLLFPLSKSPKVRKFAEMLLHPYELLLLLKYKFIYAKKVALPPNLSESSRYCYEKLTLVSRSFAAVILELPDELREPICNFYLVLRALDTVEDDMTVDVKAKVEELKVFHEHLYEKDWKLHGYGTVAAERDMLEQFPHIAAVFQTLKPEYQDVIADITKRMGVGMAEFALRDVVTIHDYELYCHYVAGLVGIGLSHMFARSGLENEKLLKMDDISNSMGLFLQKTNITRDYLEDITAANSRMFYPKEIWGKYAPKLAHLRLPEHATKAVHCLNEMVTNAMIHIPDCVDYLNTIKNPAIFKFCAIPQAMAIATLAKLYDNHEVFEKEVKIRKGEAVSIIMDCTAMDKVCEIFLHFINDLQGRIKESDPNAEKLRESLSIAKRKLQQIVA